MKSLENNEITTELASQQLLEAIKGNDTKSLKALLSQGADVNWKSSQRSPQALETEKSSAPALKKKGTNNDQGKNEEVEERPVFEASAQGHVDCLELLIQYGGDVLQTNSKGLTPLHMAVKNGQEETCRVLIENKADVNFSTGVEPPLVTAVKKGFEKIAKLLIANGADVNHCNRLVPSTPIKRKKKQSNEKDLSTQNSNGSAMKGKSSITTATNDEGNNSPLHTTPFFRTNTRWL